ncbi:TonB-dependent receptor [Myroides phaeus]|uniref:TonB-dependent receptor n=1 Tax=Myroides phaeus TaxID=702745 RepID=UPI002DBAFEC7|nr:TonB-dependent receptor [Myroides phaeus]MEC4117541.1 TonB-dependent receptor [Myroides phaeus]
MNNNKIYTIFSAVTLLGGTAFAQEKTNDTNKLGTEVVNVVRAYDATISDAFKVRALPNTDEDATTKKKDVVYTISSFPVASTFVPEKGKAAEVEKSERLKNFNNYVMFGAGNYTNLNGEAFLSHKLNKNSFLAGYASHFSSQGGIKDLLLDDAFSKTKAGLVYGGQLDNFGWNAEVGGSYQLSNWYGLPTKDVLFNKEMLNGVDESQHYKNVFVNAGLEFRNSPFTNLDLHYDHFWDDFSSVENRVTVKPHVKTQLGIGEANLGLVVDYVGTEYKDAFTADKIEYKHLNIGAQPSLTFQDDNYSVQLGLGVFYNDGKVAGKTQNNVYVYPQIKASYNLVPGLLVTYAGIEGGLKKNSFRQFTEANPFVSPDLLITPTDEKYDIYIGLKGKLDNTISYNVKGSYKRETDKAFFVHNEFSLNQAKVPYMFGNSFGVEYNTLKTFNLFGELRFDFEENVSMGIHGEWNNYDTDAIEAWNLAKVKAGADFKFDFTDQWFAGLDVFYVGKRKDAFTVNPTGLIGDYNTVASPQVVELNDYVDLNIKVGYRPTKNWTLFVKGSNLLNDKYSNFDNFRVQGVQIMGGAMYKFDF